MTDREIIAFIVKELEGGAFTDDPLDLGKATRWGVTQRALGRFLGRLATVNEVKALTFERACEVHRELSLMRNGLWQLEDWRLKFVVVDVSINFGDDDAIPWLQRAVDVKPDGALGPLTLAAVKKADPLRAALRVLALRQRKHSEVVHRKPAQIKWLRGWMDRCTTLLERVAA